MPTVTDLFWPHATRPDHTRTRHGPTIAVVGVIDRTKRVLLGRALRSQGSAEDGFSLREALPVFSSDALSSNAYATQELLMVLALGGLSAYAMGPWVALLVVLVFTVIVFAYRFVVREYPSGGGDYDVARVNLGERAGAVVAAAVLVDYALTMAVSLSAVMANVVSVLPQLDPQRAQVAIGLLILLALLNLRGLRHSHPWFIVSTYSFVAVILLTAVVAAIRSMLGEDITAESADWQLAQEGSLSGLAMLLVVARAFSSGSIAVTGVEAIGTGVPSFARPRGRRAAQALVVLGALSMLLFVAITWLAFATRAKVAEVDSALIGLPAGTPQQTLVVQIAAAVYENSFAVALVVLATLLILVAAANSSLRSFTFFGSILARDGLLPRQLHTRGDRLAFSNGILLLTAGAIVLVWVYEARVTELIPLYIIGVFVALTLGQVGMVRHWTRLLRYPMPPEEIRSVRRARALANFTALLSAVVLGTALVSKFTHGAWVVAIAVPVLYLMMRGIQHHYESVQAELAAPDEGADMVLPPRVSAIVLVSRIHKPTLRAIAYARATRPTTLEAVAVAVDPDETRALVREWERREIPVPLRVLDSPYREMNRPVLEYITSMRRESPRDLIAVYIPEYTVAHWWEKFLHNQSPARLRRRLITYPNVTLVSVPWQMATQTPETYGGQPVPPNTGGITGSTGVLPRIDSPTAQDDKRSRRKR